jgi:hypothetical protein
MGLTAGLGEGVYITIPVIHIEFSLVYTPIPFSGQSISTTE